MIRLPFRTLAVAALALLLGGLAGCAVLTSPERNYDSNRRAMRTVEHELDYVVDRAAYRLERIEVTDDAVTFHYLGVAYPGDQAWVVRFSEKSTELEPERLASVEPAVAVIRDQGLQPGFAAASVGTAEVEGVSIEAATYTFRSTLAPKGRTGRGVLAALRRVEGNDTVIYQVKLDNHGDRAALTAADLAPFIAPLATRSERNR